MHRLLDWGADGIMTDRPTLLEQVLAERRGDGKRGGKKGRTSSGVERLLAQPGGFQG
jgi:hypothetical protein